MEVPVSPNSTFADAKSRDNGEGAGKPDDATPTTWAGAMIGWWWEIGGAIVTALCVGFILIILAKADGLALDGWTLPIQPNSLISVFTTVGKSAIMVPIAGCISQLSWQHFSSRPQSLDNLRVFDDASRGPWGALELLFMIRDKAILPRLLAIAAVLSLGIEPFTQQILEFGEREHLLDLPSTAVQLGSARIYTSQAFQSGMVRDDDSQRLSRKLTLENDISNAILGYKSQPYFLCPSSADNCTFPTFTTLGVCGSVEDNTDSLRPACEKGLLNDTTCRLGATNSITFNKMRDEKNPSAGRQSEVFALRVLRSNATTVDPSGLTMTAIRVHSKSVLESIESGKPPTVEQLTLRWSWCAQTYVWTNASAGVLTPGPVTTENLESDGTNTDTGTLQFLAKSSKKQYFVNPDTASTMWSLLAQTLESHVLMNTYPDTPETEYDIGTDSGRCRSFHEMFLYTADLRNVTASVAAMISGYIRSGENGDNSNASVVVGKAWADETFIKVRWGWIVLPLALTLAVVLLLFATMFSAKWSGLPLFGASPLGLLFHGLEGREGERLKRARTRRRLMKTAKGIEVRFGSTQSGSLRFVPVRGEAVEVEMRPVPPPRSPSSVVAEKDIRVIETRCGTSDSLGDATDPWGYPRRT
ncbi:hypothetical protein OQA88_1016 [Cercophora sp. LCS_1]